MTTALRFFYRAIHHPAPVANDNDPRFGVRMEWIVSACAFLKARSAKLHKRGLRLIAPTPLS